MSIEQRIDLKFLVRLGKTPTETLNLLQEVTEMLRCQELRFLSGTRGSEREERMWKIILRVEGQQQAEQTKMLSM